MIDNKSIDYESEYNKSISKLVIKLRQKYNELAEDRDYVKSLLDVEFEKRIKLQKENEQLKSEYKVLHTNHQNLKKFVEDNFDEYFTQKELYKQVQSQSIVIKGYQERNDAIFKENKELKQELKIYRKFVNCGNCYYHDYDWFEDGDEFEICDKGNDVTVGICEEWKKF